MAIQLTYDQTLKYLSKIHLNNADYQFKDVELAKILTQEIIKDSAVTYNAASDVTVPTHKAVADFIDSKVQGLASALSYKGMSSTDPALGTATVNGEVVAPEAGNVVLYTRAHSDDGSVVVEFIGDGTTWQELGSEGIYLTKIEADALFNELKGFAYTDKGQTDKAVATGATPKTINMPSGINVTLKDGETAPATVEGNYSKATGIVEDTNGVAIGGTITEQAIELTPATAKQVLKSVKTAGAAPSLSLVDKNVDETRDVVVTEAYIASVDETNETLNLSAAPTKAINWSAGSMPEFDTETITEIASAKLGEFNFATNKVGLTHASDNINITKAEYVKSAINEASLVAGTDITVLTGLTTETVEVSPKAQATN